MIDFCKHKAVLLFIAFIFYTTTFTAGLEELMVGCVVGHHVN